MKKERRKMKLLIGILFLSGIIVAIELPSLLKKGQKKELYLFSFFLLFSMTLNILHSMHFPLPNPLDWLSAIFKPFNHLIVNER